MPSPSPSARHVTAKRALDLAISIGLLITSAPVLVPALGAAAVETRRSGVFKQVRIGKDGVPFNLLKVRTMHDGASWTQAADTTVTTTDDPRITRSGRVMRRLKIDELPQLVNVLRGDMSLVGPRPDVPGFADVLEGEQRRILSVRPGITGPATLTYRHEEELLASVDDPEVHNREVIWPDKVRINLAYVDSPSVAADLRYLRETVASVLRRGTGAT